MNDHAPTLVEQFLHVTLTERKAVVEPQGAAEDAQWTTVAAAAYGHSRLTSLPKLSCQNPLFSLQNFLEKHGYDGVKIASLDIPSRSG